MSSQPAEHSAWRIPEQKPPTFEQLPGPFSPQAAPRRAAAGFRKRQYRFSVRADIDLLKLVLQHNPYGAPHGGRLHKWQAIADTLRESGIDIDFRRARDRTALLLEQWRDQDLSLLRRCGSGNQEDQAEKEHLLDQISTIEQAAKPREIAEWRRPASDPNSHRVRIHDHVPPPQPPPPSQHPSSPPRMHPPPPPEPPQAPHSQQMPFRTQGMPSLSDNVEQQSLNVIASASVPKYGGPSTSNTFSPSAAAMASHHGQLPPLVQNHDPVVPPNRGDTDLHVLPFGTAVAVAVDSNPAHHPEKLQKSNEGKRFSPPFSQAAFAAPSSHTTPMPLPAHSPSERRSPPQRAADILAFRSELPLFRAPQRFRNSGSNAPVLGSGPLDVNTVPAAVPNSPRIGEGQNIQLDPLPSSLSRQTFDQETAQLRHHVVKLERILEDVISLSRKRLELDERRLNYERDRDQERLQLEKVRINKEFEDRKEEREDRRRREERDNEERERLLKLILRNPDLTGTEGGEDNPPD